MVIEVARKAGIEIQGRDIADRRRAALNRLVPGNGKMKTRRVKACLEKLIDKYCAKERSGAKRSAGSADERNLKARSSNEALIPDSVNRPDQSDISNAARLAPQANPSKEVSNPTSKGTPSAVLVFVSVEVEGPLLGSIVGGCVGGFLAKMGLGDQVECLVAALPRLNPVESAEAEVLKKADEICKRYANVPALHQVRWLTSEFGNELTQRENVRVIAVDSKTEDVINQLPFVHENEKLRRSVVNVKLTALSEGALMNSIHGIIRDVVLRLGYEAESPETLPHAILHFLGHYTRQTVASLPGFSKEHFDFQEPIVKLIKKQDRPAKE